ncbi:MAG: hypothetical protein IE934_17025, partial [Sphingopyxis sp.]|nr:hypothetical protein [Sphingopyxis sp.]
MIDLGVMESVGVARAARRTGRRKLICSAGLAALSVSFAAQAQIAPSVPTREEIQRPTLP